MAKINFLALAGFAVHNFFGRAALGMNDVPVDAGETHRVNSAMTQGREDVSIDLAGKDHLGHFQRRVVRDPAPFDNRLGNAHLRSQLAQLLAPTMYDAKTNADLMHQRELFRQ